MKSILPIFSLSLFSLSLLLMLFLPVQSIACSCNSTKPNVLTSLESNSFVFIGSVESLDEVDPNLTDEEATESNVRSAEVVVEKVFKGNLRAGDSYKYASGDGVSCGLTFTKRSVGKKWLFYADRTSSGEKEEEMFVSSFCDRSKWLQFAKEDLRFLENLEKYKGMTRISGTLSADSTLPRRNEFKATEISLINGKEKYRLKPDDDGFFEIYAIPAGTYQMSFDFPPGIILARSFDYITDHRLVDHRTFEIDLGDAKHVSISPRVRYSNSISGIVIDPTGMPMNSVRVRAEPIDSQERFTRGGSDYTDKNGRFTISDISGGNFLVIVNDSSSPSHSQPFVRTYYPGTFEKQDASIVAVEMGKNLRGMRIQIPKVEATVKLTGILMDINEKPVKNESVEFVSKKDEKFNKSVRTDDFGRFTFVLLKNSEGEIFGSDYIYANECKAIKDFLEKNKIVDPDRSHSNRITLVASYDRDDLVLKFPHPTCP